MKNAYVSVVIASNDRITEEDIRHLDEALAKMTRAHEIILSLPHDRQTNFNVSPLTYGPLSLITCRNDSTSDQVVLAGLSRAAGDFIVEWRGKVHLLDDQTLTTLLSPTDKESDLVELVETKSPLVSRVSMKVVNVTRPPTSPIRKAVGRVFSRQVLQQLLRISVFEPILEVAVSEVPARRQIIESSILLNRGSIRSRTSSTLLSLVKGSRLGTVLPLVFAGSSAAFGIGAAAYALLILLLRGETPEGWTTLMVVVGLGQAAILTMLALTWARINSLTRSINGDLDALTDFVVLTPEQLHSPERNIATTSGDDHLNSILEPALLPEPPEMTKVPKEIRDPMDLQ